MSQNAIANLIRSEKRIIWSGIALGILMMVFCLIFTYLPLYQTVVRLYIRNIPRENIVSSYESGSSLHSESGYSNPLFNYLEILSSQQLSDRVFQSVAQKYPHDLTRLIGDAKHPKARFHKEFVKLVQAKVIPSTDILKIHLKWDNAQTALEVFQIILSEYQQLTIDIRKETEKAHREYLEQQLDQIERQLKQIQEAILNYREAHHAIDLANESQELTRARVDLEKQAQILRSELHYSRTRLGSLAGQLGVKEGATALKASGLGADPYLVKLNQDLALAQEDYARLSAKMTDNHPDIQEVRNRIASLKQSIEARQIQISGKSSVHKGFYDPASVSLVEDLARVQAEHHAQRSQLVALGQGIASMKNQEKQLPQKVIGLEGLLSQEATLKIAYNQLSQKLVEARIKENQIDNPISILDPPTDTKLSLMEPFITIISCLLLGLFGGLTVARIKQDLQGNWGSTAEIEAATGQKVLGILPWIARYNIHPPSNLVDSNSFMGLSYAKVLNTFLGRTAIEDAQVIAFISTSSSRKGSPVTLNITNVMARLKKSVVLIDASFSPTSGLPHLLNQSHPKAPMDLADLIELVNTEIQLSGHITQEQLLYFIDEALIKVEFPMSGNVFSYLSCRKPVANIYDHVASQGFNEIIHALRYSYEFIFIDTPSRHFQSPEMQPILQASDASVLITSVHSNRKELMGLIREHTLLDHKILGIVARESLNTIPDYLKSNHYQNNPLSENTVSKMQEAQSA